jgi:hypothetical protein
VIAPSEKRDVDAHLSPEKKARCLFIRNLSYINLAKLARGRLGTRDLLHIAHCTITASRPGLSSSVIGVANSISWPIAIAEISINYTLGQRVMVA